MTIGTLFISITRHSFVSLKHQEREDAEVPQEDCRLDMTFHSIGDIQLVQTGRDSIVSKLSLSQDGSSCSSPQQLNRSRSPDSGLSDGGSLDVHSGSFFIPATNMFLSVCVCVCTSACVMLVWPGSFKVYMIWEHSGQLTRHGFIMLPNFY